MDFLSIYASILSTFLAIPVGNELIRNFIKPLRFICRSHSVQDVTKGKPMEILNLFDITIVNVSKEDVFLSKIEIEFKDKKRKLLLTHTSKMVNVDFPNKLNPGQNLREYGQISDNTKNLNIENINRISTYSYFRVIVQSSIGKTFKSKWYKHQIIFHEKTSKWQKLDSFKEYNEMVNGAIS